MNRELVFTKPFVRDYLGLPDAIRFEIDKALRQLLDDPRHPGAPGEENAGAGRSAASSRPASRRATA